MGGCLAVGHYIWLPARGLAFTVRFFFFADQRMLSFKDAVLDSLQTTISQILTAQFTLTTLASASPLLPRY